MNESSTDRATYTLPSTLETVDQLEQAAERFAAAHGFNEDSISSIAMAVREAAVNAVLHGNCYSRDKQVTASIAIEGKDLKVQIADEGAGFNVAELPDPLSPENILRGSGRGIFLMRAMMDEVNFRQMPVGTELTLIKHRVEEPHEA